MGEGPMLKTDAKERVEGAIIIERIEELIRKNSESLIAEIKNLNKKTKPQPYQEPPIPLNNLVAEEEIEEIKKTDRLEKKGKK